jgi:hypothetical protein
MPVVQKSLSELLIEHFPVMKPDRPPPQSPPLAQRSEPEIFPRAGESDTARWIYGVAAVLLAIGWYFVFHAYWAPAHDGVDQNGYLVGGRMFADHLSTGMEPADWKYGFVGRMWIGTPWMTYYPKYPIGLPIIYAGTLELGWIALGRAIAFALNSICWSLIPVLIFISLRTTLQWQWRQLGIWRTPICVAITFIVTLVAMRIVLGPLSRLPIDGPSVGVELAYLVCPMCTLLGLVATFQLVRLVAGSFGAILAMIAVACSPVTLELANNSNSHASSLFCVSWGMFLLIRWWQSGGTARACLAGFLLGYAVTIRYTEGLLLLPLVLAALLRAPWRCRRAMIETALLLAWWAIPVMFLLCFNLGAFGSLTGYDSTNESTGFSWQYFQTHWDTTTRQFYNSGLFFILPVAVAGLVVMFVQHWRMALLLASWIVPSLIVYTAYYWAPDNVTTAYLRFYLTIFPALAMAGFWLMARVIPAAMAPRGEAAGMRRGVIISALVFALLGSCVLSFALGGVRWERDHPSQVAEPPGPGPLGRRPPMAGMNRRADAEALKAEREEDLQWFSDGSIYVLRHLPPWVALAAVGLALIYGGAWWLGGRTWSVLGADARTGAAVAGAGLLALIGAAMSIYIAIPEIESQLRGKLQQAVAANVLVDEIGAPPGSVVFGDEMMLKHLQFVGDYQLYNVAQFTVEFVRSLAPERFDPDQPQPLQPERGQMLFSLLHKYNQNQLQTEERRIVDRALAQGKRVYVMVRSGQVAGIRGRFFPGNRYKTVQRAIWQEPPDLEPPIPPRRPGQPFGGPPPPPRPPQQPQSWVVMEVLPLPPRPVPHSKQGAKSADQRPETSAR